jgi:hypothetical protein
VSGASRFISLVFSTTDFYGNLVTLSEDTWNAHVIIEHPAMAGFENLVEKTIQGPDIIRLSTASETGVAFVSPAGVGPSPEGIRVLVNYVDIFYEKGATSGKVQTAYPVDVIKYGSPKLGRVIYKKGGHK